MTEIKKLREKYGLSQKKLGEMYHIPWRTIQNWEAEDGAREYISIRIVKYPFAVSCDGKYYKRSGSTLLLQHCFRYRTIGSFR